MGGAHERRAGWWKVRRLAPPLALGPFEADQKSLARVDKFVRAARLRSRRERSGIDRHERWPA
jgi:hypothetical protein